MWVSRFPMKPPILAFVCLAISAVCWGFDCRQSWKGVSGPAVAAPLDSYLTRHRESKTRVTGEKLNFIGVEGRDVYNPTAPFKTSHEGKEVEVIAARVESRDSESAETVFFQKSDGQWKPLSGAPVFKTQDPFVTRIGADLVVGGVETFPKPGGGLGYRTVFRRGKDISSLEVFATGPEGMKDIRLLPLPGGKILVLTRPQGATGGRGKVAMTVIENLKGLTPDAIGKATIYEDLFVAEEWGGGNELHLLKNGMVGVLGHVAKFDAEGNRHYYPMTFALNPETGHRSSMKILLERSELPAGASKRKDLQDVLFSGGLVRRADGTAELYVGAGDAEVYRVNIADPFQEFETP